MRVLWSTMLLQMKNSFSRSTFQFVVLIQPIFFATIMYMVFKDSGIESFVSYVILGSGLISLWSSIVFSSAGDIERERGAGNLELLGVTTTPFPKIMYGKVLGNTLLGVGSIVISFLWVTLVFHQSLVIQHPMLFLVGFFLMILSFMNLSVILAAIFTMSRSARGLMNCMEYPIYILTGMVFPLSMLPDFVLPLSWVLSPTWAIKVLQLAIEGTHGAHEVVLPLVMLLASCFLYYAIGKVLFKIVQMKTRRDGTLGVY